MKYKIYLEDEYNADNDEEPYRVIECDQIMLDYELQDFCTYLYTHCDGWEWMKDSTDRILAIDLSGNKFYYSFELDYDPVFYISQSYD